MPESFLATHSWITGLKMGSKDHQVVLATTGEESPIIPQHCPGTCRTKQEFLLQICPQPTISYKVLINKDHNHLNGHSKTSLSYHQVGASPQVLRRQSNICIVYKSFRGSQAMPARRPFCICQVLVSWLAFWKCLDSVVSRQSGQEEDIPQS